MFRVMVLLRHVGQDILNLASRGPTPSATFINSAQSRHKSCSHVSSTMVLPSFLQFKQTGLIIVIVLLFQMVDIDHSHQSSSETASKATSETTSESASKSSALEGILWGHSSRFWSADGSSKLIETHDKVIGFIFFLQKRIIKGVNWVVSSSGWNHQRTFRFRLL